MKRREKNGNHELMSIAAVIAAAALAENIVLAKMLGLCPFTGLSRRMDVAIGVGFATAIVLTVSSAAAWLLDQTLLQAHSAARPLMFIALAAAVVQAAEQWMKWKTPRMHRMLGVYLPLIATNCAVLGVMLLTVRDFPDSFWHAAANGLGGGVGFMLAVVLFAAVRERISESQTPEVMRGAPLAMITAGWMALAFSGLTGAFA